MNKNIFEIDKSIHLPQFGTLSFSVMAVLFFCWDATKSFLLVETDVQPERLFLGIFNCVTMTFCIHNNFSEWIRSKILSNQMNYYLKKWILIYLSPTWELNSSYPGKEGLPPLGVGAVGRLASSIISFQTSLKKFNYQIQKFHQLIFVVHWKAGFQHPGFSVFLHHIDKILFIWFNE